MSKFEKRMRQELDDSTPDLKDKIKQRAYLPEKRKVKWSHIATPILAMCILLVVIITPIMVLDVGNGNTNGGGQVVNKYILSMKVNDSVAVSQSTVEQTETPSIQITYKNGVVLKVKALNKTGLVILQTSYSNVNLNVSIEEGLIGRNINEAIKRVVQEIEKKGFLVDKELDIIIKDETGIVSENEIKSIGENIKTSFDKITLGKMSEDELDDLEDIIEENPYIYYEYFKQDFIDYLETKKEIITNLINVIFNEAKNNNAEIKDIFEDKDLIEDYYEGIELINDSALLKLIEDYSEKYEHDILEDIDTSLLKGKELFEIYDDLLDEYKEVVEAYNDIINNKMPDDIDDMLEDIYFGKNK